MNEQKAFYEIEQPAQVRFMVAVRRDDPDACECAVPDCQTNQDAKEYWHEEIDVYQCDVCGQWFCIDHLGNTSDMCVDCLLLPLAIRKEIIDFRERLNALR